jgi:drug/metabolite transporter (DMT)-like permease
MLLGMSFIPMGDTAGKLLSGSFDVEPGFIAWSRFAIGAALAFLVLRRLPPLWMARDWRIWLRGALISVAILSIMTALKTEPIASVFGAFFVGPAVSYILSVWLLNEPFSRARFLLVLAGFAGVLLVIQPGPNMNTGLLFAVLAGLCYGAFLTASKWLAPVAVGPHLLLSQLLVGSVLLAPVGLTGLPYVTVPIAGLTLLSAGFSAAGNMLLIVAYRRASATSLAPIVYFQIVAATALGAVVFGTLPDALTWAGLAIVLVAGTAAALVRR